MLRIFIKEGEAMKNDLFPILIFGVVGYAFSRAFIEVWIYSLLSKSYRKRYKEKKSLFQRYWLIGVKDFFKIKYLRSERRIVNYSMIISVYSVTHATLFFSLIALIAIAFAFYLNLISERVVGIAIVAYCIEIILSFAVYALVSNYEHYNYYRRINGKKEL